MPSKSALISRVKSKPPPRPDLPKRLAARVRAAQSKVENDRWSVLATEKNIASDTAKINEFEADPVAFAARYYRGHGVDSYPVNTTIARSRERVEYDIRRQPVRIERLAATERALVSVEEDVLREVEAMRPTKGRVAWPPPLPTMKRYRETKEEADRRWENQDRREREAYAAKEAEDKKRWLAERDRREAIEDTERARAFALLPLEEQAKQREAHAKIVALVETGNISKNDLFKAVLKTSKERNI